MADHDMAAVPDRFSITLRPNCSLSMMATVYVFLVISLVALVVGMAFARVGAWPVLAYTLAVLMGLRLGFQQVWRQSGDYEQLWVEDDKLLIEICTLGNTQRHAFNRHWVGVKAHIDPAGTCSHLVVFSHGKEVRLGRHTNSHDRLSLLSQLKSGLWSGR